MNNQTMVPQSEYTRDNFISHCSGADRFSMNGYTLAHAHKRCFDLAEISENESVLDIGFGRGEMLFEAHKLGAKVYGIDYADASVEIAREFMEKNKVNGINIAQAELPNIEFMNRKYDKILFLDVIEHIHEPVVLESLDNISKVSKSGTILIIHTDNKYFQEITVPIINFVKRLLGKKVPVDEHAKLHVNYQSLIGLKRKLREREFKMVFADYIYPAAPEDLRHWQKFSNRLVLKAVYMTLKFVLKTPLKHLICPTFDIKCKKT